MIYQLQKTKSNFPKFCKAYGPKNQKTNLLYLCLHLAETFALILHSKIVFKKFFWLKLSVLKNTLHALNPLIPGGDKRSHILQQTYSF